MLLIKRLAKKAETIEGALEIDEKYFDRCLTPTLKLWRRKSQLIDDFVDELDCYG